MNLDILLLPAAAGVLLVTYLMARYLVLQHHSTASQDTSASRLALLVGTRRAWGESDASLKRRADALSRWPYTKEAPDLAWWARLWGRIWRW